VWCGRWEDTPRTAKCGITFFKNVSNDEDTLKTPVSSDVTTEQRTLVSVGFSLTSLPSPPGQLLTSNLFTNILFIIHKTCCGCYCPSRFRACRNRHVRVPEGLWMAELDAAQPGWRSGTQNTQPVTPLTSNIMSSLQSCLMCSWPHPADLWHIKRSVYLTLLNHRTGFCTWGPVVYFLQCWNV
jgi:hypothetical protein